MSNGIFDCDTNCSSLSSKTFSTRSKRTDSATSLSSSSFLSSSSSSLLSSSIKNKSSSLKDITNKLETDKFILLKTKNKIVKILKKEKPSSNTAKSCSALNIQRGNDSTTCFGQFQNENETPNFYSINDLEKKSINKCVDALKRETAKSCSRLGVQESITNEKVKVNLSNLDLNNLRNDLESKIRIKNPSKSFKLPLTTKSHDKQTSLDEETLKNSRHLKECKNISSKSEKVKIKSTKYYNLSDLIIDKDVVSNNLFRSRNDTSIDTKRVSAADFFTSINSKLVENHLNKSSKYYSTCNLKTYEKESENLITDDNTTQQKKSPIERKKCDSMLNLNSKNGDSITNKSSLKIVIEPGSDQEEAVPEKNVTTKTSKSFSSLDCDKFSVLKDEQPNSTPIAYKVPILTSKSAYFQKRKSEFENGSQKKVVIKLVKKSEESKSRSAPPPPPPIKIRQSFFFKKLTCLENNEVLFKTENKLREKFQRHLVNKSKKQAKLVSSIKKIDSSNLNETYKNCLCNYLKNLCINSTLKKLDLLLKKRSNKVLTSEVHTSLSLNEFHVYFTFLNKRYSSGKRHEFYSEFRRFRCLNNLIRSFLRYIYLYKNRLTSQFNHESFGKTNWPQAKTFSKGSKSNRFSQIYEGNLSEKDNKNNRFSQIYDEEFIKKTNIDLASSSPSEDLKRFIISFGFKPNYFSIILAIVLTIINKKAPKIEKNSLLKNFLTSRKNLSKKNTSKNYFRVF